MFKGRRHATCAGRHDAMSKGRRGSPSGESPAPLIPPARPESLGRPARPSVCYPARRNRSAWISAWTASVSPFPKIARRSSSALVIPPISPR